MRRATFMHQRQPTGGARPKATQNGRTDLEGHSGAGYAGSRPYLGSGLRGSPEHRYNLPFSRVPALERCQRVRTEKMASFEESYHREALRSFTKEQVAM